MAKETVSAGRELPAVDLKNPGTAAFLAWLIPGLGHLYQGRTAKGALFFVCIMGTFAYGLYLGSSRELGYARVVYASWREGDKRLPFLCQIGVGLPSMPALIQAIRDRDGKPPLFHEFMARPRLGSDMNDPPTVDKLQKEMNRDFEFGTTYTMIAGLLNILAIYDAWGGPIFASSKDEEEKEEEDESAEENPPLA